MSPDAPAASPVASQHPRLSPEQAERLDQWLPAATLVRDHSWPEAPRAVLQVQHRDQHFIVKAGTPEDGHMTREITAHHRWLRPWTSVGRAPAVVHADAALRLLVTQYLPGRLVLGSVHQDEPALYEQAGALLATLHEQESVIDADDEARQTARAVRWLDGPHRIAPHVEEALRSEIANWPAPPSTLVPTHGDWQPRNWLIHQGVLAVIDLGRAALRPAMTDFARLAAQDFARDPALEEAFLRGYGHDPRQPGAWHRVQVREAIGTAAWAYQVGATEFEAQGHRMIAAALRLDTAGEAHE